MIGRAGYTLARLHPAPIVAHPLALAEPLL
jgi:hypothetical protein